MKILFYINRLGFAGAQKVITNLANAFCDEDEVIFVTSYDGEDTSCLKESVRYISIGETLHTPALSRNIRIIQKLRKLLKIHQPDVAVSFMAEPNLRMILSSFGLPTKTIVSVRNDPSREYHGRLRKRLATFLFRFADGHVFQTEDAKNFFPRHIQERSAIIFNSVDPRFFTGRKKDRKDIVNIGRLEPQKNQMLLLLAFAQIAQDFPTQNLHFYGKGHQANALKTTIKELGLKKRVFIHSPKKNINEDLSRYRLFVLSSDYEGMPNVLMEAMAMGIPCISTDCPCGGPRVLLAENQLVPVRDVDALSQKMREFLMVKDLSSYIEDEMKTARQFEPQKINAIWHEYLKEVGEGNGRESK